MKADEIRQMTPEEIQQHIRDLTEELFNLRFQRVTRQLDDPLRIRRIRRDIARLKTILHEHEKGIRRLASEADDERTG